MPLNRSPKELAAALYNPGSSGAISLEGVLEESFRLQVLHEIRALPFIPSPAHYGTTYQELEHYHCTKPSSPALCALLISYDRLYTEIGKHAGFTGCVTDISIHRFKPGSKGIGPHRDESKYINLIGLIVLEGNAPFLICREKTTTEATAIPATPGTLILMRAPRHSAEKCLRPIHAVGPVQRERYTIGLRVKQWTNSS